MWLSFYIYGSLVLIMSTLGVVSSRKQKYLNYYGLTQSFFLSWEILCSLLVFSIISGLRWNVGVDYVTYLKNFNLYKETGYFFLPMESGFEFITKFFVDTGLHYSVYFAFLALLQITFVYKAVEKDRYIYPYLAFVIICGVHYLSWMNGIRQMVVAAAFTYIIRYALRKSFFKYFSFIFLLSFIHSSAFLLMPFYLIRNSGYFLKKELVILIAFISILVGQTSIIGSFESYISAVLSILGYDSYVNSISYYTNEVVNRAIGPRTLATYITFFIVVLYSDKLKDTYENTSFFVFYKLSVIGFISESLLASASHIFLRPVSYFTIFSIFTTSFLLHYVIKKNRSNYILFFVVALSALAYLPITLVADSSRGALDYSNYKLFFYKP